MELEVKPFAGLSNVEFYIDGIGSQAICWTGPPRRFNECFLHNICPFQLFTTAEGLGGSAMVISEITRHHDLALTIPAGRSPTRTIEKLAVTKPADIVPVVTIGASDCQHIEC